jgi:hypothetical protein
LIPHTRRKPKGEPYFPSTPLETELHCPLTQVPVLIKFHTYNTFRNPCYRGECSTQYYRNQDSTRTGLILRVALWTQIDSHSKVSYDTGIVVRHTFHQHLAKRTRPFTTPMADGQRICKHRLHLRSDRITTDETTPVPTCIEPSSLLTTHGVPIALPHYFLASKMTPVQSYRTMVLPGTSSRQSLRERASSHPDCSDQPK